MKKIKSAIESDNDFLDAEYTYFRYLPLNSKVAYFYSDFYNGESYKTKAQAVQVIKDLCIAFGYETIPFLPLTVEEILKYYKLTMEEFKERVDKQFDGDINLSTVFYFRAEEDEFFYIGEHAEDIFDELLDEFFAAVYIPGVSKEFLRQVFDHLYIEFKTPGETNELAWVNESATSSGSSFTITEFNKMGSARYDMLETILNSLSSEEILRYQKEISGKDVENFYEIKAYMPIKKEEFEYFFEESLSEEDFLELELNDNTYIVFEQYGFGTHEGDIDSFYNATHTKHHIIESLIYYFSQIDNAHDDYISAEQIALDFDKLMQLDSSIFKEDLTWANESTTFKTLDVATALLDALVQLDDFDSYLYVCEILRENNDTNTFEFFSAAVVREELNEILSNIDMFGSSENPPEWFTRKMPYYTRVLNWLGDKKLYEDDVYNIHTFTRIDSNADFEDYFRDRLDEIAKNLDSAIEKNGLEHFIQELEKWNYLPDTRRVVSDILQQFYLQTEDLSWANESIHLNNKKKKEVNMITTQVGKMKIKNGKAIVESKVTTVNKGKPLPKITKADPRKSDKAKPKSSATKASLATTLENAKTKREFMNAGMEALGSALNTRKLLLSLWSAMKEQKPNAKELNNTLEGALKVKDNEKEAPKRELPKQRRRLEGPRVKKIEKTVKFSK